MWKKQENAINAELPSRVYGFNPTHTHYLLILLKESFSTLCMCGGFIFRHYFFGGSADGLAAENI